MIVAFLSASGELGGAERSLLDIAASLRAAEPDWSLHLIVPEDGPLAAAAGRLGVQVRVVPLPRSISRLGDSALGGGGWIHRIRFVFRAVAAAMTLPRYLHRLRHVVRGIRPSVVHANGFKMHLASVWAARVQLPVVWHVHDFVSTRRIMARALRRYADRCAVAVANSDSVARDLRSVCGSDLRIERVYNAVDLEYFSPSGPCEDVDALAGLDPAPIGTVRVGLVATMARWKGHDVFLQALALLPRSLPLRGYIIGGAVYRTAGSQRSQAELRDLAGQLGIDSRVGYVPFVRDVPSVMRALDIVVHASTQPEPFGLVVTEAMGVGKPVIVANAGGAAELITDGQDALSHVPGDAQSLSRQIDTLVTDPSLRSRLGGAARRTAESRFDRRRLGTEFAAVYRVAMGSSGRGE